MNDKNDNSKVAIGILVAGIAGYAVGVLTAPKSGRETRQDIKDNAGKAVDLATDRIDGLREDIDDLVDIANQKLTDLKGRAKEQLADAIDTARDAKRKSAEVAKAVRRGEADQPELNRALKQLKDAKKNLSKYLKS